MSAEPMAAAAADLAPKPPVAGNDAAATSPDGAAGGSNADFCIPAKRMKDGSVCFYVTIEHLIEQTLLRALNRPEFRKTPVVVKEDETLNPPTDGGSQPPGASDSAAAVVGAEPAEQATKAFGGMPIKLQLKRKYREGAAGTDAATDGSSSSPSNEGPSEAKRPGVGSPSPPTAPAATGPPTATALSPLPRVGSVRIAEGRAGDRHRASSDPAAATRAAPIPILAPAATTLLAPSELFQQAVSRPQPATAVSSGGAVSSHVLNNAPLPPSGKRLCSPPLPQATSAQADSERRRRPSIGCNGSAVGSSRQQQPAEYGGGTLPLPSSQVAKLTAGVASHLQLGDRLASREPTSFTPPPQQQLHVRTAPEDRDLDVALDLSAKRPTSTDARSSVPSAARSSSSPIATPSFAGSRNHASLLAAASKNASEGGSSHHQQQQQQQAVSPAMLLEHYGPHFGHMFHHTQQAAAAAAVAAADLASMMHSGGGGVGGGPDVKETWRQQLALTGWRPPPPPLGYPLPSWSMPQPLSLSAQSPGRSLPGVASATSAAAASPTAVSGRQLR